MPNHCENIVTLTCPSEESAEAMKKHLSGKESLFDFNSLVPEPVALQESEKDEATLKELRGKYGHDNWYDWRYANWGTKWNSYECELDESQIKEGILEYRFDTAWAPPEGVCRELLEHIETHGLNIEVDWFYREPMNGLLGQLEGEI